VKREGTQEEKEQRTQDRNPAFGERTLSLQDKIRPGWGSNPRTAVFQFKLKYLNWQIAKTKAKLPPCLISHGLAINHINIVNDKSP
jgi:hypothetical protein